ncbi:MAG TPA: hypothetical protein VMU98_04415 [Acidimicrobiales bacterium]|nr:hypothetical protein [Acidimicrobiales bacterium]
MTTQRLLENLRGQRYGEVILAYEGNVPHVEVFNSFLLNECPDELWQRLDPVMIARQYGAALAVLNGPRYWMMDGVAKVANVEPVVRDFGGIVMRRVATIELDGPLVSSYYQERIVNRGAMFIFDAGRPVHLLHSGVGRSYVLQAYCVGVDASLDQVGLATLGERLDLPEGWSYESRLLEDELVVDTTTRVATVVQDELQNTYSLLV